MTFGFGNQHSIQLSYGRTVCDSTAQCEMTSILGPTWNIIGGSARAAGASRQAAYSAGLATQVAIMFLAPDTLLLRRRSARYTLFSCLAVGMRGT